MKGNGKNSDFSALLKQRAASVENTRKKLCEALDRFESKSLQSLPAGSKLTVRSLAIEAKVSKDTPLSRYTKNHLCAGQLRFPEIAARFNNLKGKLNRYPEAQKEEKENKRHLREKKELKKIVLLSARANNLLDAEVIAAKTRVQELEEDNSRLRDENAKLRQGGLKLLSS